MAHVWCCPRRAGAAGHHVCPSACSNTDFQHTKPYLTAETGVLPTWNAAARRAAARRCCVKLLRAAHVWDANVGDDRSVPKRWQWAAAHSARANRKMVSCTRKFSHAQTYISVWGLGVLRAVQIYTVALWMDSMNMELEIDLRFYLRFSILSAIF